MINNEVKIYEKHVEIIFEDIVTLHIPKFLINDNIVDFLKQLKLKTIEIAKDFNLDYLDIYNHKLTNGATLIWALVKIERGMNNE